MNIAIDIKTTIDNVDKIIANINELTKTNVYVGYPSTTAGRREGAITNAALGYIHEHGSPAQNIPARPHVYPAVAGIRDVIVARLRGIGLYAIEGKTEAMRKGYEALGILAMNAIKRKIIMGPFVKLSDVTIAARRRRGVRRTQPLRDTAQMLNSVNYVVRK